MLVQRNFSDNGPRTPFQLSSGLLNNPPQQSYGGNFPLNLAQERQKKRNSQTVGFFGFNPNGQNASQSPESQSTPPANTEASSGLLAGPTTATVGNPQQYVPSKGRYNFYG